MRISLKRSSKDNNGKIHLLHSINIKIEDEINNLLSILMLRFVADDYLRKM